VRARHLDRAAPVDDQHPPLTQIASVLDHGARVVRAAAHGRGPVEPDEVGLEQVQQRAVALAEVAPGVVEQEGLRVLERRRDPHLELELDPRGTEPVGVDLEPVQLLPGAEVGQLEGVEARPPLRAAQWMLFDDPPEHVVVIGARVRDG
jgi:hypothetical protein